MQLLPQNHEKKCSNQNMKKPWVVNCPSDRD